MPRVNIIKIRNYQAVGLRSISYSVVHFSKHFSHPLEASVLNEFKRLTSRTAPLTAEVQVNKPAILLNMFTTEEGLQWVAEMFRKINEPCFKQLIMVQQAGNL